MFLFPIQHFNPPVVNDVQGPILLTWFVYENDIFREKHDAIHASNP